MQVSQSNDFISHAVIGGIAPINFSISNSAEFFHILSSTLYSDQILAVVREVLCNAWDAHIVAGVTDKPIQITIKDCKLIIKDSGHGIDPDDMGDLYATYGGTNKKNDGNQTGGFGLGCKAPFAYTEHFEVQSCHKGIKTIYNISRSCAKIMGVPSIIPIVSLPTEDTGLQVTITLQTKDINRFTELVNRIVYEGEMFATLNGNQLKTLGFVPEGDNNYLAYSGGSPLNISGRNRISIRYGNVIYPISNVPDQIAYEYELILDQLRKLSSNSNYFLLIQAPANSISVTPSRESLSMQEHTINTLRKLFINFLDTVNSNLVKQQIDYVNSRITDLVDRRDIPKLLEEVNRLLIKPIGQSNKITTIEQWARQSVNFNFRYDAPYAVLSIKERINQLRGIIPISPKLLDSITEYDNEDKRTWLNKEILYPLIKKIMKNPQLSYKRLFTVPVTSKCYSDHVTMQKVTSKIETRQEDRLPYLRNIIFLSSLAKLESKKVIDELNERNLGNYLGFHFYHLSRKTNEANAARQFFKESGMIVIDLTEKRIVKIKGTKTESTEPVTRRKGVPLISALMSNAGSLHISRRHIDTIERTDKPEFVIWCPKSAQYSLDSWGQQSSNKIAKYFGYRGAVVNSMNQYQTYIAKGAKPLNTFLANELIKYVRNSKAIWEFQSHNRSTQLLGSKETTVIRTITDNKLLSSLYGITDNRTEKDKDMYSLLMELYRQYSYFIDNTELTKLVKDLDNVKLSDEINNLFKKVKSNPAIELLSAAQFEYTFRAQRPDHELQALAFNLIQIILNH